MQDTAKDCKTVEDRIRYLLKHRWGGNQNAMARAVNCSQSTLSRVVRGQTKAGKRLVKLIADQANIDAEWLYEGHGAPTIKPAQELKRSPRPLPILPSLSASPADLKARSSFSVPVELAEGDQYWYEVPPNAAILESQEVAVLPYDLLLLQFGVRTFGGPQDLDGVICVAKVPVARGVSEHRLEIGIARYYEDRECGGVDFCLEVGGPVYTRWKGLTSVTVRQIWMDVKTGEETDFGESTVPACRDSEGRLQPISSVAYDRKSHAISFGDVVAVCAGLVRRRSGMQMYAAPWRRNQETPPFTNE